MRAPNLPVLLVLPILLGPFSPIHASPTLTSAVRSGGPILVHLPPSSRTSSELPESPPTAASPPPPVPRPIEPSGTAATLAPWLGSLGPEPSVDQVLRWTMDEVGAEAGALDDLVERSRRRGALPVVRLRGRYADGSNRDWDGVDVVKARGHDSDTTVELSLEWDLAELAGNSQEFQAMRDRRDLYALRQSLAARATATWFDRRRVLLDDLRFGDNDLAAALERRLRVQELDATLDALTGGRWSRGLKAARALAPSPLPPLAIAPETAP